MPGAGFYPIDSVQLVFRRDGRWYGNGEPVEHERLARLFSRYVRRKPTGGFEIWIDERFHADVEVEDTPFVVMNITQEGDQFLLELNDGSVEILDPSTLSVGQDNSMYCSAKAEERVLLLRPAYYALSRCIEDTASGEFVFRCGNQTYPIRQAV